MVYKTIMLSQQDVFQEKFMELELKRLLIPQHILLSARINFTNNVVEHMQSILFTEYMQTYEDIMKEIYKNIIGVDEKKHCMRLFSYTNMLSLYQHENAYQEQIYRIQTQIKGATLVQVIVSLHRDQTTDMLYCFVYMIEQNQ